MKKMWVFRYVKEDGEQKEMGPLTKEEARRVRDEMIALGITCLVPFEVSNKNYMSESEMKKAIEKYVLRSFHKQPKAEQEEKVEEYFQKAYSDNDGERIMILQSCGYFRIDKEGNFVNGFYAD